MGDVIHIATYGIFRSACSSSTLHWTTHFNRVWDIGSGRLYIHGIFCTGWRGGRSIDISGTLIRICFRRRSRPCRREG